MMFIYVVDFPNVNWSKAPATAEPAGPFPLCPLASLDVCWGEWNR